MVPNIFTIHHPPIRNVPSELTDDIYLGLFRVNECRILGGSPSCVRTLTLVKRFVREMAPIR